MEVNEKSNEKNINSNRNLNPGIFNICGLLTLVTAMAAEFDPGAVIPDL